MNKLNIAKLLNKKRRDQTRRISDMMPGKKPGHVVNKVNSLKMSCDSICKAGLVKKQARRPVSVYDLSNFVVQSNPTKISMVSYVIKVTVPKFKELDLDFYTRDVVTNRVADDYEECDEPYSVLSSDSDEFYENFHDILEKEELDKKENYFRKIK